MITTKDIILEGHPTLLKKAKDVSLPLSAPDLKLGYDLIGYVKNSQDPDLVVTHELKSAVGLAAPQINISKRMFAMHCEDFDGKLYSYVIINPVIIARSKEITYLPTGEGCLSVEREITGITPRYMVITFKGWQLDFSTNTATPIELTLEGFPAIVFQHEYDHLEGVMFTSKVFDKLDNATPLWDEHETDIDYV